jgi:hypothetical protein
MPYPLRPWTEGMIDMSPAAVRAREIHAEANIARASAEAVFLAANAHRADTAQVRLDADQEGQRAYWLARNFIEKEG